MNYCNQNGSKKVFNMLVIRSIGSFLAACPHCKSMLVLPMDAIREITGGELPSIEALAGFVECECREEIDKLEQGCAAPK